jgi:putative flippase GtrA
MDTVIPADHQLPQPSVIEKILVKYPVVMQGLRFIALGVLNTALDFIILNFLSKSLGIEAGAKLGFINIISFSIAVLQSYLWNRYWVFGGAEQGVGVVTNLVRLMLVGGLGAVSLIGVLLAASASAGPFVYLVILVAFILIEVVFWFSFRLAYAPSQHSVSSQFSLFLLVSIIGLLINSVIVSYVSQYLLQQGNSGLNTDSIKNAAKVLATGVSLFWNFIGYKLLVFRK